MLNIEHSSKKDLGFFQLHDPNYSTQVMHLTLAETLHSRIILTKSSEEVLQEKPAAHNIIL